MPPSPGLITMEKASVSINSPAGVPISQFKTIIPIAGGLLFLFRASPRSAGASFAFKTGEMAAHLEDVEEMEIAC